MLDNAARWLRLRADHLRCETLYRMCLADGLVNDGSLRSNDEPQTNPRADASSSELSFIPTEATVAHAVVAVARIQKLCAIEAEIRGARLKNGGRSGAAQARRSLQP